jgi:CAAX protease family protein
VLSTPAVAESPHRAVAPAWHTAVVLFVLLGYSLAAARAGGIAPIRGAHARAADYLVVMTVEWVLVAFIWHGASRRGFSLRNLIGGSWTRPIAVLRDLGIALGFLVVAGVVLNGLGYVLKAAPNQALRNLLPRSPTEIVLYLMLALTAGFCEELIFRGYLQRQFAALTRASAGGIVLQGVTFGAVHGYQGWKYMLIIAVFGTMFGLLAHWRRSLRPCMLAHFLQDGIGGLVAGHLLR